MVCMALWPTGGGGGGKKRIFKRMGRATGTVDRVVKAGPQGAVKNHGNIVASREFAYLAQDLG